MLLDLLVAYANDAELRERFARNPIEVLDEHQVSQEERALLRDLDLEWIKERMVEQVPEVLNRVLELREEWKPLVLIYGPDIPKLTSLEPQEGRTGANIPFTIRGKKINIDAVAFFKRPEIKVFARDVRVNRAGTILRGIIKLREAGEYHVGVDNGESGGTELVGTLHHRFIAKAD